jgi:Asp-tRNA(Asn)/Glu-tRNA(Gln) amidotransferase A subunit family amidase
MGLLRDQRDAIAKGMRTSVELVTDAVTAAEKLQSELNAFTQIHTEEALAAAANADRSPMTGQVLRGVPVAVKDLYDVSGHVTSACSAAYRDDPPATADAPAVEALRSAGAIIIGKTNMHELAFGATNTASCYGPANNPWDTERIPGGSSGGSGAAVGARIVGLALGTDTGGSIRMPAAFCGATGLKTTWGLLPLAGVTPMAPSLDSVGPIASDAVDAAIAFDVLRGGPPAAGTFDPPEGLRVGIARDPWLDVVTADVGDAMEGIGRWFASRGARIADVSTPWFAAAHDAWCNGWTASMGRPRSSSWLGSDCPPKMSGAPGRRSWSLAQLSRKRCENSTSC